MCPRLIGEATRRITFSIMECIENCLRPEELQTAFDEIHHRVRAGIESYAQIAQREILQVKPSRN